MSLDRPEPARQIPVHDVCGYVDRIGVRPGATVPFHVHAPSSYDLSIVKLGVNAITDPAADSAADRADIVVLDRFRHDKATPQTISPGSYVYVTGEAIGEGPLTLGLWLRLWRLPVIDVVQWAWFGLITDLDYPEFNRFGLIVDHAGRFAAYAGDGGAFRHEWLHTTGPVMADRLGEWVHVAATVEPDGVTVYLDGVRILDDPGPNPSSVPGPRSRLRIGASAEQGRANDFLDGDIAAPFVAEDILTERALQAIHADRARTPVERLVSHSLAGTWPLTEETGRSVVDASGHGRHGRIVQGGTWQIGGPAHDPALGAPGYDPRSDPERGHGLRLSSDDLMDAEWAVTDTWEVPLDAAPGIYAARIVLDGQASMDATSVVFAVGRTHPASAGRVALLLSTNTWYAYGRRPTLEAPMAGLSASFYSNHVSGRPYFHVTTLAPIPRADPYGYESERATLTRHSHLVRPERFAEAWLRSEGYPFEAITDTDLDQEPGCLSEFQALLITGHSEYWSGVQREAVDRYLASGGQVVSLSGNTLCWRTSFSSDRSVLECRKTVRSDDKRWLSPGWWGERWHADDGEAGGSYVVLDRPAWQVLGLDTQGMIDDGTSSSFSPITVVEPDHPLFHVPEEVPTGDAGNIGITSLNGPLASGYEFDATPDRVGLTSEPVPGLTILASAIGQRNIEWNGIETSHGCDVVYWERPQGGRVFNAASIGLTGSLVVDAGLRALLRNVMARFGVAPTDS